MFNDRLQQLTTQISKMTPQQRQRFAMQHKNDPILVSMTKFVNDQENSLRNSLKAQQNPPNPARPPVVDEVIAGMAALPAPNINPPAVGIAAGMGDTVPQQMRNGGKVKKYAGATGSWVDAGPSSGFTLFPGADAFQAPPPPQDPDALAKAIKAANDASLRFTGFPLTDEAKAHIAAQFQQNPDRAQRQMVPRDQLATQQDINMRSYVPRRSPSTAAMEQSMLEQRKRAAEAAKTPEIMGPPVTAKPTPAAGGAGGGGGGGIAVPAAPRRPVFDGPQDMDPIAKYRELLGGETADPFAKQRSAVTDAEVGAATDARDRAKRDIEEMGLAGLDREKRLNKRQERLDEQERKLPGMAMLEAGLSMMASKSPYALQGIGEGALKGTKVYREGLKDLEAGREKLDDAFANLEALRRGEEVANRKELREREAAIKAAMTQGVARTLDGMEKAWGYKREDAKEGLKALLEDLKSKRQLAGDIFRGEAAMYGSDQALRGSLANANAHVKAAGIRAAAGGADDDDPLKRTRVIIQAQRLVDGAVNEARDAAMKSFQTWGPMQEQAARQRAIANLPPDVRQLLGSAALPPAAPTLDPSQFTVREKR